MIHQFVSFFLDLSANWGYWGIFFLMTLESSFVPFPSEIVIPPAAYLAYIGQMNLGLVVLFGILGSLAGALINYYLAYFLGRPIVFGLVEMKWAKWFMLSRLKIERADVVFLKYGGISTFLGRLLPGIRQLISIPAGFAEMKLGRFLLYTGLGSGLWVCVLAAVGYFWGANQSLLEIYYGRISAGIVVVVLVGVLGVWGWRRRRRRLSK